MTLDELTRTHTPVLRPVGRLFLRAACACGWTGCTCTYPAQARDEHRDHLYAVLYQWERDMNPEAGT